MTSKNIAVKDIQMALAHHFDFRKYIIVPNVSFGLLNYEADLILLNRQGFITEIEIKRTIADFRADFKKKKFTLEKEILCKYFFYCVPFCMLNEVEMELKQREFRAGIITYDENCNITVYKDCGNAVFSHRKLFIEEQLQLARLGTMRIWNKISNNNN